MASKVAPDVTGASGAAAGVPQESHGLRRAVGVWGSFTWGYADVGADVYVALGIVMAAAQGATNVAFLFAVLLLTKGLRSGLTPRELPTSPFFLQGLCM